MATNDVLAPKPKEGEAWDIVIIGSGPAALTAAVYTTRGAASTLILGGATWGGQLMLTTTVDNFPGFPDGVQGPQLMQKMRNQAERFGAVFKAESVGDIEVKKSPFEITAEEEVYKAKSMIIATGAETLWLGVPGEGRLCGRGVSSCAPCDAPFFMNKEVVVVGGGDSAMEETLVLTKYASKVTLVHRRDEFRASAAMQKKVFDNKNINILWDTEITEMIGGNFLESIKLKTKINSKMAVDLKSDKLNEYTGAIDREDSEFLYWQKPVQGVFVAVGHTPATRIFQGKVNLDKKGYVEIKAHHDENADGHQNPYYTATNIEGIFVAGDVHDYHYKQAITAAGFGCMAAMDTLRFLDKETPSW
jgi:thioredoxin reductase (NADPH)